MTREELIEALNREERIDDGPVVILALACAISGGVVIGGLVLLCRAMGW